MLMSGLALPGLISHQSRKTGAVVGSDWRRSRGYMLMPSVSCRAVMLVACRDVVVVPPTGIEPVSHA